MLSAVINTKGNDSHLLHALRRHPHAHAITDVKAQRLVGAVLVESDPSVCLR